jgi:hypothetical protein
LCQNARRHFDCQGLLRMTHEEMTSSSQRSKPCRKDKIDPYKEGVLTVLTPWGYWIQHEAKSTLTPSIHIHPKDNTYGQEISYVELYVSYCTLNGRSSDRED